MRSVRRSVPALVGLLLAGVVAVVGANPASAQLFGIGSSATAIPGGPAVECPTLFPQQASGGGSSGGVSVSDAVAQCAGVDAQTNGFYNIGGATGDFSAQCTNFTPVTNGGVRVPAGTTLLNGTPLNPAVEITDTTTVRFPNGSVAILNEVIVDPGNSVTRNAIRIISGPGAGTVIGQVVCGEADHHHYPLRVDSPGAAASPDVALTAVSGEEGSSSDNRMLYVGGAILLLVLAQVAVGRTVVRRRRGVTGS